MLKSALNKIMWVSPTVRITATPGKLTLTARSLDVSALITIPYIICESWECSINGKLLAMVGDGAMLTFDGAAVRTGTKSIPVLEPEYFVVNRDPRVNATMTLDADTWRDVYRKTAHAISTDKIRYYLNGIAIQGTTAIATDGHQMAIKTFDAGIRGEWENIILPAAVCAGLTKLLGKKGNPQIVIAVNETVATIHVGDDLVIDAKLIDGTFPQWQAIVPTSTTRTMTFKTDDLRTALIATKLPVSRRDALKLTMTQVGPGVVIETAYDGSTSNAPVLADIDGYIDRIRMNHRYMSEIIASFGGALARVKLNAPNQPMIWEDPSDPGLTVVLSPML